MDADVSTGARKRDSTGCCFADVHQTDRRTDRFDRILLHKAAITEVARQVQYIKAILKS
jgi:hypothetical protein